MLKESLNKWYTFLILVSGCIGALSSILVPIMAMRGVLLGVSLSIGVIIINSLNQKELSLNQRPTWKTTLLAAIIAGGFAGIVVNLWSTVISMGNNPLGPIPSSRLGTFALCLCYSVTMHIAYALRWNVKGSKPLTIILIGLAGGFSGIVRAMIAFFELPQDNFDAVLLKIFAPFSGIIFAMFWAIVVTIYDPAWSFERWNSTVGSDNPG